MKTNLCALKMPEFGSQDAESDKPTLEYKLTRLLQLVRLITVLITCLIIGYALVEIATGLYEHPKWPSYYEGFLLIAFFVLAAYGSVRNNKLCLLSSGSALFATFTIAHSGICGGYMFGYEIWCYMIFSPMPILAQAGLLQLLEEGIQRSDGTKKLTLTVN